ncbi:unnamed protein product, partial [marine sediment metagenome]
FLGGTVTIDPGHKPVKYGSALNYFDATTQVEPKLTFTGTFLWNSDLEAHRGYYAAGTNRLYSLATTGTQDRSLRIMFPGVITEFGPITDLDGGAATVDITIEAEYKPTATMVYLFRVFNLQTNLDTINPI